MIDQDLIAVIIKVLFRLSYKSIIICYKCLALFDRRVLLNNKNDEKLIFPLIFLI